MQMRAPKTVVALGAVAMLTSALTVTTAAASSGQSGLAATRAATDKYHDVAVAEADGYLSSEGDECVPQMGIH